MKRTTIIFIILVTLPFLASGQFKAQPKIPSVKSLLEGGKRGLIDFTKIRMTHSYSMSFSSSGGRGATIGLYQNTMSYKISDPLEVKLKIGLVNNFQNSYYNGGSGNQILYGTEVTYKPSDNFQIYFEYGPSVMSKYYTSYGYLR